eukprot:PITA_01798
MKPFFEKEIVDVIWSMQLDKALGPDGFTIHFYRACWNVIKLDFLRMVKAFQKKAKVGGCTNSTFLALIPKEVNPESFNRFRPISLCNASYKILAKLLANRLKPLLGYLISPLQGGFVKERHLINNVIQVQEALHSSHSQKEKGMLIKLDMSNAFDRVRLSFLYKILLSFGFSADFVNMIKACTHRPWIAPLVSGRPSDFFQPSRGPRQGCSLSPFLYILMAESLSRKLTVEMEIGTIPGALINKRKSVVYGWNVKHPTILQIACILGFPGYDKWEKIKYLGLPLTLGPSPPSLWTEIISKIKEKIAYWGGQWLTKAGKFILIKAVLSALPIFHSSPLLSPESITDQISKLLRDFLWNGGKGNQSKLHLVRWDILNRPLQQGVL